MVPRVPRKFYVSGDVLEIHVGIWAPVMFVLRSHHFLRTLSLECAIPNASIGSFADIVCWLENDNCMNLFCI